MSTVFCPQANELRLDYIFMDPLSESIYQLATIQFLRTSCELILLFSALNSLNYRAGYHI